MLSPNLYDSTPIDALDRRITQLRGLCGVLIATTGEAAETFALSDLRNLCWLLDDYLVEIADLAKGLHESAQEVRS